MRFLASRPRSVAEIERHLRGKRYEPEAIERAIDQLRAARGFSYQMIEAVIAQPQEDPTG